MDIKSTVTSLSEARYRFSIEIAKDDVQNAFETFSQKLQKELSIKGFRKGKAPMSMIKTAYATKLHEKVADFLIRKSLQQVLEEHKHRMLENESPHITLQQFSEGKPFKFTAEIESYPSDFTIRTDGLRVIKEKLDFAKISKMMACSLQEYAEPLTKVEPIKEKRDVQINDTIVLDCKALSKGKVLSIIKDLMFDIVENEDKSRGRLRATQKSLEKIKQSFLCQEKSLLQRLQEGFWQMRVGDEKDISIFNDETLVLQICLKQIYQKTLLPIDDQFAKKVGFSSLSDMKSQITKDCKTSEEIRIHRKLQKSVLLELVKNNPIDISPHQIEKLGSELRQQTEKKVMGQTVGTIDDRKALLKVSKMDQAGVFKHQARYMLTEMHLVYQLAVKWNVLESVETSFQALVEKSQQYLEPTAYASLIKDVKKSKANHKSYASHPLFLDMVKDTVADRIILNTQVTEVEPSSEITDSFL